MRFATDILVVEQPLRRDACLGKADDHAVDGGDALGLVVPLKGAMGEEDVEAVPQHFAPEHPDLLALGDGVGGDEGTAGRLSHWIPAFAGMTGDEVRGGFQVPRTHEVEYARTFQRPGDGQQVRSEEHTSELQSLMRISYAVFCLKKKK